MKKLKKIIRSYFESLYSTHQVYLDEIDNFLDRYKKLNWDQRDHLNNPTSPKGIELFTEIHPTKGKTKGSDGFNAEF